MFRGGIAAVWGHCFASTCACCLPSRPSATTNSMGEFFRLSAASSLALVNELDLTVTSIESLAKA
jgi:hypothetical protein